MLKFAIFNHWEGKYTIFVSNFLPDLSNAKCLTQIICTINKNQGLLSHKESLNSDFMIIFSHPSEYGNSSFLGQYKTIPCPTNRFDSKWQNEGEGKKKHFEEATHLIFMLIKYLKEEKSRADLSSLILGNINMRIFFQIRQKCIHE